jgi:multidrug efflux system membrane fusion protein
MRTYPILGLILTAALAAACSSVQGKEEQPARPVKAEAIAPAPAQGGVRYSASIEPFEQVSLAFKSSGYVDELLRKKGADGRLRALQAGDIVPTGTVLARVREADYRERVEQSKGKLAEGDAAFKKARLDLDRAIALFAKDSLTKPDLDSAQASFDTAQARVAEAKADLELAANALRDCALVTPSSGVLLERKIELGSLVGVGTVGFTMGDVRSVKARFGIPDGVISSVVLGDTIGVTVDSVAGTTFSGRVTAVSPTADPHSRVFDVEVTIPNGQGQLRPGMIGTVAVGGAAEADSSNATQPLLLPLSAAVRSPGNANQYAVFVVERQGGVEIARLRRVELGDVMGNGVAVRTGLAAGDHVITTGATLLTDGDRIRVIP